LLLAMLFAILRKNMDELSFSIMPSLRDIPRQEWDRLFGQEAIEGYGYQKTLEEAGLKEFSFGYLVGKRREKIAAIIPFFLMDFSFCMLTQGLLRRLMLKFKRFFTLKVLFLGSPSAEEFYLGVSGEENLPLLMDGALEKLFEFCKKEKINGIAFNNLSLSNRPLSEYLAGKKFIRMESLPGTLIKIEAHSLQEYIKGLSKNTRKDLKRKLKRSAGLVNLRTEVREDIGDILDAVYKLYLNNFDDSSVHFEILTPEFFKNICRNMPGIAKFFITRDGEKIVAFNLCFIKGGYCIDKFIGLDYAVAHKYHLYFTTLCHNIDWCIKNGIRFYQPGTTDYHPKLRLGARLIPLYIYTKSHSALLNWVLKISAPFIEPRRLDPTLKPS